MVAEVHRLTEAGPIIEPPAEVLAIARDLLRCAESGEVKGCAIAYVDGADTVVTLWDSGCASSSLMVAASAVLHGRIMDAHIGDQPIPPKPAG